jgi:hypothetical protein
VLHTTMHFIDITFVEWLLIVGYKDLLNVNRNSKSQVIYMTTHCNNKPSPSHAHCEMLNSDLLSWNDHFKANVPLL